LDEAMGPRPRRCGYPSVLGKTKLARRLLIEDRRGGGM
jgi:hypothetical protein